MTVDEATVRKAVEQMIGSIVRSCPSGHLSLTAANWACPWCMCESSARQLEAAEAEVERLLALQKEHAGLWDCGHVKACYKGVCPICNIPVGEVEKQVRAAEERRLDRDIDAERLRCARVMCGWCAYPEAGPAVRQDGSWWHKDGLPCAARAIWQTALDGTGPGKWKDPVTDALRKATPQHPLGTRRTCADLTAPPPRCPIHFDRRWL